jgi:phosphohistidine phosphatase SixA
LPRYLLLMRHGRRVNVDSEDEDDAAAGEPDAGIDVVSALSRRGARETREVAEGLKDYLLESRNTSNRIHFRGILVADTLPARATFAILNNRLPSGTFAKVEKRRTRILDPTCLSPYLEPKDRRDLITALSTRVEELFPDDKSAGEGDAVLIVGHQPQLTWFVGKRIRRYWPTREALRLSPKATQLPSLARSEVACLRRGTTFLGRARDARLDHGDQG